MNFQNATWILPRNALFPALVTFVAIAALAAPAASGADDDPLAGFGAWRFGGSLGVMSWPSIGDIRTPTGQSFDARGYAVELTAHKNIRQWEKADLLVGVDFGIFGTSSNVQGRFETLSQRGLYLTPSVKVRFPTDSGLRIDLEAGAGWYEADFAELDCDSGYLCTELDDPFNADTLGGYIGIGAGFGPVWFANLRAHYADFGQISGVPSLDDRLRGPFYILSVGGAFGGSR